VNARPEAISMPAREKEPRVRRRMTFSPLADKKRGVPRECDEGCESRKDDPKYLTLLEL
jgi:hypothetical protein